MKTPNSLVFVDDFHDAFRSAVGDKAKVKVVQSYCGVIVSRCKSVAVDADAINTALRGFRCQGVDWDVFNNLISDRKQNSMHRRDRAIRRLVALWSWRTIRHYRWHKYPFETLEKIVKVARRYDGWEQFVDAANLCLISRHELSIQRANVSRIGEHDPKSKVTAACSPLERGDFVKLETATMTEPFVLLRSRIKQWVDPCKCLLRLFDGDIDRFSHWALEQDDFGMLVPCSDSTIGWKTCDDCRTEGFQEACYSEALSSGRPCMPSLAEPILHHARLATGDATVAMPHESFQSNQHAGHGSPVRCSQSGSGFHSALLAAGDSNTTDYLTMNELDLSAFGPLADPLFRLSTSSHCVDVPGEIRTVSIESEAPDATDELNINDWIRDTLDPSTPPNGCSSVAVSTPDLCVTNGYATNLDGDAQLSLVPPPLTILATVTTGHDLSIEEMIQRVHRESFIRYHDVLQVEAARGERHRVRSQWFTVGTRLAKVWVAPGCGLGRGSASSENDADVWYYTAEVFHDHAAAGKIFTKPVVIKDILNADAGLRDIEQYICWIREAHANKKVTVGELGKSRSSIIAVADFVNRFCSRASSEEGWIALSDRDMSRSYRPQFTMLPRFDLLESLTESMLGDDRDTRSNSNHIGIGGQLDFNILTSEKAFSGARTDTLGGTWVRVLEGKSYWMTVSPNEMQDQWNDLISQGDLWLPNGKERLIVIEEGDVLITMPDEHGRGVVNSVHFPQSTLMRGGIFWDKMSIIPLLRALNHNLRRGKSASHVIPACVIDRLEEWVERTRHGANENDFHRHFREGIEQLKQSGCRCTSITQSRRFSGQDGCCDVQGAERVDSTGSLCVAESGESTTCICNRSGAGPCAGNGDRKRRRCELAR